MEQAALALRSRGMHREDAITGRPRPSRTASATILIVALMGGCGSVPPEPSRRIAELGELQAVSPNDAQQQRLAEIARLESQSDLPGNLERAARLARDLADATPGLVEAQWRLGRVGRLRLVELLAKDRDGQEGKVPNSKRAWDQALYEDAETALRIAATLAPREARYHSELGMLFELEGHLEAALLAHERALGLAAFSRGSLLAAARLATALGEERRAVRHLEALRAVADPSPQALEWEARCYLVLADDPEQRRLGPWLERAERAFAGMRRLEPKSPRGAAGIAHCRFRAAQLAPQKPNAEQLDAMRTLYLEAARLAPSDPVHRFNLGVFLESKLVGDNDAARQQYRAALDRDAKHLPSRLNLARLLWLADRKDDAKAQWRIALPQLTGNERKRVEELLAQ